jgi:hypothetical protein
MRSAVRVSASVICVSSSRERSSPEDARLRNAEVSSSIAARRRRVSASSSASVSAAMT